MMRHSSAMCWLPQAQVLGRWLSLSQRESMTWVVVSSVARARAARERARSARRRTKSSLFCLAANRPAPSSPGGQAGGRWMEDRPKGAGRREAGDMRELGFGDAEEKGKVQSGVQKNWARSCSCLSPCLQGSMGTNAPLIGWPDVSLTCRPTFPARLLTCGPIFIDVSSRSSRSPVFSIRQVRC